MSFIAEGATIPDSKLGRATTDYIRDTETDLLFNHSSRLYHFGALAGLKRGLTFDHELLYAGAMFHDIGLMPSHGSKDERFEVDGAHAARDFLKSHGISKRTPTRSGRPSRFTPRPAFRSTCTRLSRS